MYTVKAYGYPVLYVDSITTLECQEIGVRLIHFELKSAVCGCEHLENAVKKAEIITGINSNDWLRGIFRVRKFVTHTQISGSVFDSK